MKPYRRQNNMFNRTAHNPMLYHSVLAAVAEGNTTRGSIAGYIGRKATDLQHPLTVLEDVGLLIRDSDPLRAGRSRRY